MGDQEETQEQMKADMLALKEQMASVATYPSAGGQRVTRGMRVPRKEYARSRHQRLFEENV